MTNQEIARITINNIGVTQSSKIPISNIASMAITKSGKLYIAKDTKLVVYNNFEELTLNNAAQTFNLPSRAISMAVDPSESLVAVGTYDGSIWLKQNGNSALVLALHKSSVNDVKFNKLNSGSLQLASAGFDQTIKLIDVKQVLQTKSIEDIVTLNDGGHTKWIYQLWYSNDGEHLYSCGEDKKIIGWKKTMEGLYKVLK